MSKFGQISSYSDSKLNTIKEDPINGDWITIENKNLVDSSHTFLDLGFKRSGSDVFQEDTVYYFKATGLKLKQPKSLEGKTTCRLNIKLVKIDNGKDIDPDSGYQLLRILDIAVSGGDYTPIDDIVVIFTPIESENSNFNAIMIQIERIIQEFSSQPSESSQPSNRRSIEQSSDSTTTVRQLYNLLENKNVIKVGVQGSSGLNFYINGYGLKLWADGVYQSPQNYLISSIGIGEVNDDDWWIIDYQEA